jgi:hypothetical protein
MKWFAITIWHKAHNKWLLHRTNRLAKGIGASREKNLRFLCLIFSCALPQRISKRAARAKEAGAAMEIRAECPNADHLSQDRQQRSQSEHLA